MSRGALAYELLFPAIAVLEIAAALLLFYFKDILHSVLALAAVFVFNALLFLFLQQPLLALLQLFILVGGVTTYLFVGVSAGSYSKFQHTSMPVLAFSAALIFMLLAYGFTNGRQLGYGGPTVGALSPSVIGTLLGADAQIMFLVVFMLFAVGLGSIMLLRRLDS